MSNRWNIDRIYGSVGPDGDRSDLEVKIEFVPPKNFQQYYSTFQSNALVTKHLERQSADNLTISQQ